VNCDTSNSSESSLCNQESLGNSSTLQLVKTNKASLAQGKSLLNQKKYQHRDTHRDSGFIDNNPNEISEIRSAYSTNNKPISNGLSTKPPKDFEDKVSDQLEHKQHKKVQKSVNFSDISYTIPNTVIFSNDENVCMNTKSGIIYEEHSNIELELTPAKLDQASAIPDDFYKLSFYNNGIDSKKKEDTSGPLPVVSFISKNYMEENVGNHNDSYQTNMLKFSDALQKASLIEDIITRRKANEKENIDKSSNAWIKRQAISDNKPPPEFTETNMSNDNENKKLSEIQHNKSSTSTDVNSDEFKFFMNAIEKLKATSLFQEDDLKKMSDEQIYDALVEHARKCKFNKNGSSEQIKAQEQKQINIIKNKDTIDKEEEDLPIIMKNLHSVKSLKHFFEIRAQSLSNNSNEQSTTMAISNLNSPFVKRSQASNCYNTNSNTTSHSSSHVNSKSTTQMIEKSIRQGTGLVSKDIIIDPTQSSNEFNNSNESSANQNEIKDEESSVTLTHQNLPVPPPLPDFFSRPQAMPQFTFKVKTQCSNGSIHNDSNSVLSNPEKDLHEKLIKEIHNKSLERSRKDSAICLDEHGNLICKPSNRIYNNSSAAKKLYKIKDNSSNTYLNGKQIQMVQKSNELTFKKSGFVKKAIDFNESKQYSNQNNNSTNSNTSNSNNPNSIYNYNRAISQQIKQTSKMISTFKTETEQQNVQKANEMGKQRNETLNDEHDNVAEMITLSQIPTLERANGLCDSSSELRKQVYEAKRTTSFKSDLSNYSNTSSRSMLSEAKAKLEAFSGKFSKLNSSSNACDFIQQNSIHQPNFLLNNDIKFNDSNPAEHYYGEDEYLNTKF
jgi:hypothetical protein